MTTLFANRRKAKRVGREAEDPTAEEEEGTSHLILSRRRLTCQRQP